jgi:hypothetical protein
LIHFGFGTAFGTADVVPFRLDGYFFKPAVFFTGKLINRHARFPGVTIWPEHGRLSVLSASKSNYFIFFGCLERQPGI